MRHPLTITVLGSGTSVGVPTIGCDCAVCCSDDPRDKRLRPSVVISYRAIGDTPDGEERTVLVDTTPDLRQQALAAGLKRLDAVLYTHDHADHIMGLDDIRPFNYGRKDRIPAFGSDGTLKSLQRVFPYAFAGEGRRPGGVPRVSARAIDGRPFELFGLEVLPVEVLHGPRSIYGFRFGAAAYITDQTGFPDESTALLQDLDVLFLGALRHAPHPMHSTVEQAVEWVERLRPRRAFFTHICHDLPHERTNASLPGHVRLAYDGLRIEVEG